MWTKGIVGIAALFAGGFVAADNVVIERVKAASERISVMPAYDDAGAASTYKALRDQANSAVNLLREREKAARMLEREKATQRIAERQRCGDQTWPYYSGDCIVTADGRPLPVVRVVGTESHTVQF